MAIIFTPMLYSQKKTPPKHKKALSFYILEMVYEHFALNESEL